VIVLAKLTVSLIVLAQFLILFNAGICVAGMLPAMLVADIPLPQGSFFALPLLHDNARLPDPRPTPGNRSRWGAARSGHAAP
jgi:hypothetical protein